jgi:hypothetical protein
MPDGDLAFLRSDGSTVPAAGSERAPLGEHAFMRLVHDREAVGLHIDAHAAFQRWDGEPVGYDAVVYALVHLAAHAKPLAPPPT